MNPIAFVADIKMAFLMIEIDESERNFTRFFWDENPRIDLENKRLEIFRMTRVLFGVKSSSFLLLATIKHHLKKYVDIFPDTFNHLNQALYVDDFLCGNVSIQEALTTCIKSKQILEDASLGWDDKFPKQLEVSWNKWCNAIHYLNEINIPRYYFQNTLPSNATTIQLHCFSDASKKAYGTVAYLRTELNNGNIISSFAASKSRVAALKTLSIPRLELMSALLSTSDKIATALKLPAVSVERLANQRLHLRRKEVSDWLDARHSTIKEIQKLSDPKEWRYCKGKDNPADLISRGLSLNDLKNNRIWWHGPKWLTMKQTEWPLFSEPTIETDINIDKLELKKSNNVNSAVEKRQIENNLISSTKATHLEVVSNLTTEAFLSGLRRFIARRSKPSVIWSVNAMNFKRDPNTKPLDWPVGRILEVFPGNDGLVRVVNVKISTGILKRAITKVVPLPIPDDPATVEQTI
ncbi:uncharacterized protein TNCV_1832391 [Trichonephila clavipes]|nr:uncharacterized protein TNCV_1832391 [Trichonephila clavipes]